ncbi:hypothetical protein BP6252_00009 [Coleophoma cylindrospora]|uniref:G-protein coupled receptors family 1 profile domain-containing protein n=1 Tax=Coleophoma cylindrospora TaxID=1849047 RepID=A0A3D8SNV2_9HELO|nr:hypothetical protein BP6252_00009 [Coleophoma cylindrospora]
MAPIVGSFETFATKVSFTISAIRRNTLGAHGNTNTTLTLTPHQSHILGGLAIGAASISLLATILAIYWFSKMARNFRHHLIMLLILGDAYKSLWYLVAPTLVLAKGSFANDNYLVQNKSFCQVAGFMIAFGMESSDIAMLMIAVHTAVTVWKKAVVITEGGLYPYRLVVYIIWVIWPLLAASLAFINPLGGYASNGTLCYLPVRPFWYRLALSWIPRYLIFTIICGIYVAIYIHVHRHFRNFELSSGSTWDQVSTQSIAPSTIPGRKLSGYAPDADLPPLSEILTLELPSPSYMTGNGQDLATQDEKADNSHWAANFSFGFKKTNTAESRFSWHRSSFGSHVSNGPLHMDRRSSTQPILPTRMHKRYSNETLPPVSASAPPDRGEDVIMRSRRAAILRQLRLLFVYPLFYMLMWITPFINHCLNYTDYFAIHPAFGLRAVSSFMLPFQCFVDCAIFIVKEKPWRYIPGSDGTFIGSFRFWTHNIDENPLSIKRNSYMNKGPGRTHSEMVAEARTAYARREQELEGSKEEAELRTARRQASLAARGGRDMSWWDEEERNSIEQREISRIAVD